MSVITGPQRIEARDRQLRDELAAAEVRALLFEAALVAVASGCREGHHGCYADIDPRRYAWACLHDIDPLVPLPVIPLQVEALRYLRDGRVVVESVTGPPTQVLAKVLPIGSDPASQSVDATVRCADGVWNCTAHPGAGSCTDRLAVQMVTGHGRLGGAWWV